MTTDTGNLAQQAAAAELAQQAKALRNAAIRRLFAIALGAALGLIFNYICVWLVVNIIGGADAAFRVLAAITVAWSALSLQLAALRRRLDA